MKTGFRLHPENINKNGRPKIPQKQEIVECACGCGELLNQYDARNRVRRFVKGHAQRCFRYGRNHSEDTKARISKIKKKQAESIPSEVFRRRGLKGLEAQWNNKGPTGIERKLYKKLEELGLEFRRQAKIAGWLVDAYIPDLNLVIEADGDYWHSLPEVIKRDQLKVDKLKDVGYSVLRLKGSVINSGKFENMIESRIEHLLACNERT